MVGLAETVVAERLHNSAVGNLAAPALRDHSAQFSPKLLQLCDLPLNSFEMAAGDPIDPTAISIGILRKVQQ